MSDNQKTKIGDTAIAGDQWTPKTLMDACVHIRSMPDFAIFMLRLNIRMNNHLCGMKPDYDDSIVGFNQAWDIVRKLFEDMQNGK
jgi:hypothetical protein